MNEDFNEFARGIFEKREYKEGLPELIKPDEMRQFFEPDTMPEVIPRNYDMNLLHGKFYKFDPEQISRIIIIPSRCNGKRDLQKSYERYIKAKIEYEESKRELNRIFGKYAEECESND